MISLALSSSIREVGGVGSANPLALWPYPQLHWLRHGEAKQTPSMGMCGSHVCDHQVKEGRELIRTGKLGQLRKVMVSYEQGRLPKQGVNSANPPRLSSLGTKKSKEFHFGWAITLVVALQLMWGPMLNI